MQAGGAPDLSGLPAGLAQQLQSLGGGLEGQVQLGGLALTAANPAEWMAAANQLLGGDARAFAAYAGMPAATGGSGEDDSLQADSTARPNKRKKESSQADYAMRHQAAEQRRRARINERLDALKKLVPHDPRANTASFLEDVIKHIIMLKDTNERLEQALIATHSGAHGMAAAAAVAAARSVQNVVANAGVPPRSASVTPSQGMGDGMNAAAIQQLIAAHGVQANGNMLEVDPGIQQALLALQQQAVPNNGLPADNDTLLRLLGAANGQLGNGSADAQQGAAAGGSGGALGIDRC